MANRKLGKYDIRDRLGRGGMAEVYRAYHSNLDRYVAIKVLHAFLADDPEFKTRFEREAQNVAKLRHPNIVQVYDFEYDDESESYYMVMEMVDGPTLKDWFGELSKRGELMPIAESIRIIRQATGALAYAHSRSMIHRDVKPANLMLDHDKRVVLTDFGIAKIVTGVQLTASGGMVGTPAFMAPEQGLGEAGDERSDLYSIGVILFQLITGQLPYDADTPLAIILKHLNAPLPSVRDINPALPEPLDYIVQKAMAKEPQDRYQSATELIEDLDRLERGEPVHATALPGLLQAGSQDTVKVSNSIAGTNETVPSAATTGGESSRRIPWWGWMGVLVGVVASLFLIGAASGVFGSQSLTPTANPGQTPAIVPVDGTSTVEAITAGTPTINPSAAPSTSRPTAQTSTPVPSKPPTLTYTPSLTATLTATRTETPSTPIARPISGSAIVMRSGPGNQFPKVTTVETLDTVTIIGVSRDYTWLQVRTSTNIPGWVAMSAVEAYGNLGNVPVVEGPTLTPTNTPSITPSPTPTLSPTPSNTPTITLTPSPSPTPPPNFTATAAFIATDAAQKTATATACVWDYAIYAENPPDALRHLPGQGDATPQPVRAGRPYTREITFQNTGTCGWDLNTALKFIPGTGESFNAGTRIFLRDAQGQPVKVGVGETVVLIFAGQTPAKGDLYTGEWELVTPGQLRIGEPLQISVRTFEGG